MAAQRYLRRKAISNQWRLILIEFTLKAVTIIDWLHYFHVVEELVGMARDRYPLA